MSEPTRVKADIVPYTPEYAGLVRSWIDSNETYHDLCRGLDFPPPEDIIDSWQHSGVSSYLLFSQRKPVAYGELWKRPLEMAVEITHLIVEPVNRSRGYGTKMLELLYERAAQRSSVAKVILNLYGENEVALGCYLKAGFKLVGVSSHTVGLRMIRMVRG